jgi:D-alanyl-lipoteichoic acid acyltransferase DltB (MBOAT superfamily)
MVFNSLIFVAFAAVFYAFWPLARRRDNVRWTYIVALSLFFYGWWDWRYIFLLLATGVIDFLAGLGIERFEKHRKLILVISLGSNLTVLGFFKYYNFFAQNLNWALANTGSTWHLSFLSLILPVGISFYTFQSMSYTLDIYRRQLRPTRNLTHFLAAISLFPHLVAGPIMRAGKLLPQLRNNRAATELERWEGLKLIVFGFFKKMVIADNLAPAVNDAFAGQLPYHFTLSWWIVVTMFAFQIYYDFSGYSDIARGLAKWMGYDFTINFQHPYVATSLSDFWSRWHISLTTWFRDYVFFPLARSGSGPTPKWRLYYAMIVVLLLSGLWHGAAWTFVIWGACHALFMTVERLTRWPDHIRKLPLGKFLAWMLVLVQLWIAWVFFRAASLEQAWNVLRAMFSFGSASINVSGTAVFFLMIGVLREAYRWFEVNWVKIDWRGKLGGIIGQPAEAFAIALMIMGCVYLRGPAGTFIYFQF